MQTFAAGEFEAVVSPPMAPRARPRLVDVAELLSLAPSTVSRALAGSEGVSTATRERVVAAARELGYTVNPAASGLKRGQTLNIGLIAVMNHWYAGAVTSGADRVAAELGLGIHHSYLHDNSYTNHNNNIDDTILNNTKLAERIAISKNE